MARPRIIIADTDVNYILSLQLKFIEEFFEKIDLEVITDRKYFESMFESPQRAEVLIVSEDLYDLSIQKHNIGNVFLMTEKNEEEQTADLNVTRIFKYTSIKEIFNEILGKSADKLKVDISSRQETQIVVVTSATGGVGKTTVAMGICASLAKNFKKVLYINCDQLQNFQNLMQNTTPISNMDVYSNLLKAPKESTYGEIKHFVRNEKFNYIPPFKVALMSVGLSKFIYIDIARSAKQAREFDYIVLDTDSVFDEFKAALLNAADKVIFVTKQNKMSVMAMNILISNINGVNNEKYSCVCNDFDKNIENALISPEITLKYTVNEYIEHLAHYDQMICTDFINCSEFQKLIYLFL